MKKAVFIIAFLCYTSFCSAQLTLTVTGAGTGCNNRIINSTATGGSGTYMYIYSLAAGQSGPAILSENTPNYTVNPQPLEETTYMVVVVDLVTAQSAAKTVTLPPTTNIEPALQIYNAFTPNGDGINDIWFPRNANDLTNDDAYLGIDRFELLIVNQFGNPVCTWNSALFPNGVKVQELFWNGRINNVGGLVPPNSTYYYNLKVYNCLYPYPSSPKEYTGWVYLNY